MSTRVPGDLFQGTFEVFKKHYYFMRFMFEDIDERFIAKFISLGIKDGSLPFAGGEILNIIPKISTVELLIQWKMCYIEVDNVMDYVKADIWDEGFDVEFGPMLILKGIENGH